MPQIVKKKFKQINFLLNKEQTHILQTAFLLMIPTLLTKLTGQFFNLLAASYFGTQNPGWNQFIIANAIPELLTNVLLAGAVGSIVIPILISAKTKGNEQFYRVYSTIINLSILLFVGISILLILTADILIPSIINIFGGEAGQDINSSEYLRISNMLRALLLPQIILGVSIFVSNGLNVYNRFLIPNFAPLFFNIGRIFSLIIFLLLFNKSPWAIVIGTYVGAIFHLLIQIPLYRKLDLKWLPTIDIKSPFIKELGMLGIPRMFALASEHIVLTFNKFLAYGINQVGPSALFYANSISLVIPTLFGFTFSYASYPTLARLFEANKLNEVRDITQKILQEILFLALPFTMIFMVMRLPLVRLIYGLLPNTSFDLEASSQVSWVLLWFSIGWVFLAGKWFMFRLFYAAKNTFVPFLVASISLVLTIILGLFFSNLFSHNSDYAIFSTSITFENLIRRGNHPAGIGGISLAMSFSYFFEFFVLVFMFNKKFIKMNVKMILLETFKKLICGVVMVVVMYFIYKMWNVLSYSFPDRAGPHYKGSTTVNLAILTFITTSTGMAVYILMSSLLNIEELRIFKRFLRPLFSRLRI
jgi:putative peptidoglycan lipid II flippase